MQNSPQITERGKVLRDPVHGLIRIQHGDEFVFDLIRSPEFQRLRRIRQLGVSSLTYPGAEHTRFSHSLGVFNFAQRMLDILRARYANEPSILGILDEYKSIVKAAALLHDLGHGPFSHMIERAFAANSDHEKKTVSLITQEGSIPDRLSKHNIQPELVAGLVNKTCRYPFLNDVISSQLDADRMDYILRDALNTGVKYGSYDSEWVLNSLCLGNEPTAKELNAKTLRLCLDEKRGLHSAEQVVIARMHMSHQVYYHRVTRGWEAHLLCLLKSAKRMADEGKLPDSTPLVIRKFLDSSGNCQNDDWLWFDESAMEFALQAWASNCDNEAELGVLSRAFLLREKMFYCVDIGNLNTTESIELASQLSAIGAADEAWLLDIPAFTSYKDFDSGFRKKGGSGDEVAVSTNAILISNGSLSSRAQPAESISPILNALGDNPKGTNDLLSRLYIKRDSISDVNKILADFGLEMR